jgi:hypothetical protein
MAFMPCRWVSVPVDEVIRFALYYEGKRLEDLKVGERRRRRRRTEILPA